MYNNRDIRIKLGDNGFDLRACGLLRVADKLLISTESDGVNTLPGGAVKMGETTSETMVREFQEETGLVVESGSLIAIVENFLNYQKSPYHQMIYVYAVHLAKEPTVLTKLVNEDDMSTAWCAITDIPQLNLQPSIYHTIIDQYLNNKELPFQHFVSRNE